MALDRGPVGSASSAGPALPAPEGAPGRSAAPRAVHSSGRSIASPSPVAPQYRGRTLRHAGDLAVPGTRSMWSGMVRSAAVRRMRRPCRPPGQPRIVTVSQMTNRLSPDRDVRARSNRPVPRATGGARTRSIYGDDFPERTGRGPPTCANRVRAAGPGCPHCPCSAHVSSPCLPKSSMETADPTSSSLRSSTSIPASPATSRPPCASRCAAGWSSASSRSRAGRGRRASSASRASWASSCSTASSRAT